MNFPIKRYLLAKRTANSVYETLTSRNDEEHPLYSWEYNQYHSMWFYKCVTA